MQRHDGQCLHWRRCRHQCRYRRGRLVDLGARRPGDGRAARRACGRRLGRRGGVLLPRGGGGAPSGRPEEIVGGGPFDWPAGHATDDTDVTRAVLLAYLETSEDVVRVAADHMLAWLDGDWPGRVRGTPPRDVGGATLAGLRRYRATGDPRAAGAGAGQAGNGSLMRCIPTAVAVRDPARRVLESIEISAVTHDDPRCTVACAAYDEMAAALVMGDAVDAAVEAGVAAAQRLGQHERLARRHPLRLQLS
ncbi:MAG: ADP-ribosylglycohydrolase family protein [Phycicoccus sp.]